MRAQSKADSVFDSSADMSREERMYNSKSGKTGFRRGPDGQIVRNGEPIRLSHTAEKHQ